jgi:putative transcriptional regulator
MTPQPRAIGDAPAAGCLLVATPVIAEPTFFRTVVLLLEHDDAVGSLGVVLNRPMELTVADTLPAWTGLASAPGVLYAGGPVAEGSALALGRVTTDRLPAGVTTVFGPLAVVDLDTEVPVAAAAVETLRIYSGYAGWGPGQLRNELRSQAWWVLPSLPADWFSSEPSELWYRVLGRQGGSWAMWAHAAEDPEVN